MNDLKELTHTLTLYAKTEDKNFLKCVNFLASAEMEGGPEEIGTKQTQRLGSHSLLGRWYRGAMGMNSRCQPRMLKTWTAWTTLQLFQWKEVQGNIDCKEHRISGKKTHILNSSPF